MPHQIKEVLQLQIGTIRKPKWDIFDYYGRTDLEIDEANFSLKRVSDGAELLAGSCAVDNEDEDTAGNTIRTVQPTIDLNATDADKGLYALSLHVFFTNGEDDVIMQAVEIVDFEATVT